MLETLQRYWGYTGFRPMQAEIIGEALAGRDVLAILPTGGGKSICFQVPALMREGICLVVSPLIALMKDQVQHLRDRGIPALAVYSGMTYREIDITLDNVTIDSTRDVTLVAGRAPATMRMRQVKSSGSLMDMHPLRGYRGIKRTVLVSNSVFDGQDRVDFVFRDPDAEIDLRLLDNIERRPARVESAAPSRVHVSRR